MMDWKGIRVLVIGAARQGIALARYLARQGANVTLNDQRSLEQLRETVQALDGLAVNWQAGGHPLSLLGETDLVCVSGGVPLSLPLIQEARRRGIPLSNDTQIFFEAAPCRLIGITGSAGKTTTTTLVGRMAQHAAQRLPGRPRIWVGGNIGDPLISYVEQMTANDIAVVELSSFQLELTTRSPHIGAILNITPNHLDRHGTMEAYTAAKANLLAHQKESDTAVLNREDAGAWSLAGAVRGSLFSFGIQEPQGDACGVFLRDREICLRLGAQDVPLIPADMIGLRGQHNLLNVLAACAVCAAAGFPASAMQKGVEGFTGVAHRLELVRNWKGAAWYNDSIATAPERAIAALQSFNEPIVLLAGGRDKNLPWDKFAEVVHARVDHVVLFGEAGELIEKALREHAAGHPGARTCSVRRTGRLEEAVAAAAEEAQSGDVVLLSPGGTSYDEFKDFEERGERFRLWVNSLS